MRAWDLMCVNLDSTGCLSPPLDGSQLWWGHLQSPWPPSVHRWLLAGCSCPDLTSFAWAPGSLPWCCSKCSLLPPNPAEQLSSPSSSLSGRCLSYVMPHIQGHFLSCLALVISRHSSSLGVVTLCHFFHFSIHMDTMVPVRQGQINTGLENVGAHYRLLKTKLAFYEIS